MKQFGRSEKPETDHKPYRVLRLMEKDIKAKSSTTGAKKRFEHYLEYTESILSRYSLPMATTREIKRRYLKETVGISFFGTYLEALSNRVRSKLDQRNLDEKFYDWYKIEPTARNEISRLRPLEARAIPQFFTEITLRLLDDTTKSLGEFYTPIDVAQDLVSHLGKPDQIFRDGKSIIDPACGIGTLLAVALNKIPASLGDKGIDREEFLDFAYENIRGFDIHPFAVGVTRLQLSAVLLTRLQECKCRPPNMQQALLFPKIELRDSLTIELDSAYDKKPDLVVVNPPYRKIPAKKIPRVCGYKKILHGHPNLYQLFLWWSVNAVNKSGKVAALIPQTFTSGLYDQRLRKELEAVCNVNSITKFRNRSGIFPDVQQPLIIVSLSKDAPARVSDPRSISISVRSRQQGNDSTVGGEIKKTRVLRGFETGSPWCISGNPLDYDILDKVWEKSTALGDYKNVTIKNGGFVWNQRKHDLYCRKREGRLPLVYASAIKPFTFKFDEESIRSSRGKKPFVSCRKKYKLLEYDSANILIQRTIPKSAGQKIYACMVSEQFLNEHRTYFVENHVNVIKANGNLCSPNTLLGLNAWLNSRLFNFIFNLINGNSHVSIYELRSLPVNHKLVRTLVPPAQRLFSHNSSNLKEVISELNHGVYEFFDLDKEEVSRVNGSFQD